MFKVANADAGLPGGSRDGGLVSETLSLENVQLLSTATLAEHLYSVQGRPAKVDPTALANKPGNSDLSLS